MSPSPAASPAAWEYAMMALALMLRPRGSLRGWDSSVCGSEFIWLAANSESYPAPSRGRRLPPAPRSLNKHFRPFREPGPLLVTAIHCRYDPGAMIVEAGYGPLWMAYDDIFRRWCLPPGTRNEPRIGSEKRLLVSGFTCVLVTNGCDKGELPRTSECVRCDIRTSRMVAKIFSEQLFAAV